MPLIVLRLALPQHKHEAHGLYHGYDSEKGEGKCGLVKRKE